MNVFELHRVHVPFPRDSYTTSGNGNSFPDADLYRNQAYGDWKTLSMQVTQHI